MSEFECAEPRGSHLERPEERLAYDKHDCGHCDGREEGDS